MSAFNQSGFPIIQIHEDRFEVKAFDYWEFRSFQLDEVVKIKYEKAIQKGLAALFAGRFFRVSARYDPYYVTIYKKNGADWKYEAPAKFDKDFAKFLYVLCEKCGLDKPYFYAIESL